MKIVNPLVMSDWSTRSFFIVFFSLLSAMWGIISLDLYINISIFKSIFVISFISYIPGMLILKVLRIHHQGNLRTPLYAVGLSLVFIMFSGVVANFLMPPLGEMHPISSLPLLLLISVIAIALSILAYVRDRDFMASQEVGTICMADLNLLIFLFALPVISTVGALVITIYSYNVINLLLISIIAIIPILVAFERFPKKYYALAILSIALSLLFNRSMVSQYLWGWDIHTEYYIAQQVLSQGFWNSDLYTNVNSILSIVTLAPAYASLSDISIVWVFKIIYPVLFSLVPLGLYDVFRNQFNEKVAFFAVFFFVSFYGFYSEMPVLPRQEIAELFIVLFLILIVNVDVPKGKRIVLAVIFLIALIVSHYALSAIFLSILLVVMLIQFTEYFMTRRKNRLNNKSYDLFHPILIISMICFFVVWYFFIAGSVVIDTIVNIISNLITEGISGSQSAGIVQMKHISIFYSVLGYLIYLTQLLIALGLLMVVLSKVKFDIKPEFKWISIAFFFLLVISVFVPVLSKSLTFSRLFDFASLFLAPFALVGGLTIFRFLNMIRSNKKPSNGLKAILKLSSTFFTVYLLLNIGFVNEVLNDHPNSIALDFNLDYPKYSDSEVKGASWMGQHGTTLYSMGDPFGSVLLRGYIYPPWSVKYFMGDTTAVPDNVTIFLRQLNVDGTVMIRSVNPYYEKPYDYVSLQQSAFFNTILIHKSTVYVNGGSEVWY